jgi:hypothetical protein
MFIGLNPSKAGADQDDPTIRKVCKIARNLGYGGIYMVNCFPFISTDPGQLQVDGHQYYNNLVIITTGEKVKDVVFAWGNFPIVKYFGRDLELGKMFPEAMALHINLSGNPGDSVGNCQLFFIVIRLFSERGVLAFNCRRSLTMRRPGERITFNHNNPPCFDCQTS